MIENLGSSEAYCHQKGIFPAREAVVMQQQHRGVLDVTAEDVFIGNGVSELIDLSLRALLNPEDEVLIPSPDYPLWTASVSLNQAKPVYYNCKPENGFQPDPGEIASLITPRTRAIVVINPNNPTGAVYKRELLEAIAGLAEKHRLVLFSDEIYDQMLYGEAVHVPMATLVKDSLCVTLSGLSKVYRACGYRVGWAVVSGDRENAREYIHAMEMLASLRLCANVPGQWAVQTALGGVQSIEQLTTPGGRLYESRQAIIDGVENSRFMTMVEPEGAMYGFPGVDPELIAGFDDQAFALKLLEQQHILVTPGSSFNVPYKNHFRLTTLPRPGKYQRVFEQIEECLASMTGG
ncbi:MAG: aminotransferase class I/II-fold pyridoxal phosphate-dependent enzyme [Xanthomonadales bacterium]|nr:aminotransferase class I/II-fold pyridoxal phosphate-dependent enzyme [Xanthomonadales bacterium]